jgi:2-methylcitrate dehydratase PrpD
LGCSFLLQNFVFKKFTCCGFTQGFTEGKLSLVNEEGIRPEEVDRIQITVPPYAHKLVGHQFRLGENPRVNAKFSIQYCVASALLRGDVNFGHFEESSVRDHDVMAFLKKISVTPDPELDKRGHTALDMRVFTRRGTEYLKQVEIAPGFPGNPLSQAEHHQHFRDCLGVAPKNVSTEKAERILSLVSGIEELDDIRELIPNFLP